MKEVTPQPKLADIAAHAGVSLATVSRVLNNSGPVSEGMRKRVERSLVALGYEQRPAVRSLEGTIGVLISDILNPFFAEMLRGIEDEAESDGLALTLVTTMEDKAREQQALQKLGRLPIKGAILSGARIEDEKLIEFQERYGLPLVLLNRQINHPEIACIVIDLERTEYRATQHLLNLGHTQIAYLAGPSSSDSSQGRRRGIEMALAEAGLALRPDWCPTSFPNIEGGFQAMSAVLARSERERPTAVLAYNDMMALGALNAARTHGLQVPADISIVGFDDIAMAMHANPPLTTVAQPKYQMGKLAVRILRQLCQNQPIPAEGYVLLESPLIVRESTARAPLG